MSYHMIKLYSLLYQLFDFFILNDNFKVILLPGSIKFNIHLLIIFVKYR